MGKVQITKGGITRSVKEKSLPMWKDRGYVLAASVAKAEKPKPKTESK